MKTKLFLLLFLLSPLAKAQSNVSVNKNVEARLTTFEQFYLNSDSVRYHLYFCVNNTGTDTLVLPLDVYYRDSTLYELWTHFAFHTKENEIHVNRYYYQTDAVWNRKNRLGCTVRGRTVNVELWPGDQLTFEVVSGLHLAKPKQDRWISVSFEKKGKTPPDPANLPDAISKEIRFDLVVSAPKRSKKHHTNGLQFEWFDQRKWKTGNL